MTGTLEVGSDELHVWLHQEEQRLRLGRLQASDLELVRVLEDLVDVLVSRGVIRYTDLPEAAQRKLHERAEALAELGSLGRLLADEDEQHLI